MTAIAPKKVLKAALALGIVSSVLTLPTPAAAFHTDDLRKQDYHSPNYHKSLDNRGVDSRVWINEITPVDRDNKSQSRYEIAAPAGTDLTGWKFVLYRGVSNWPWTLSKKPTLVKEFDLGTAFGEVGPVFKDQVQGFGYKTFTHTRAENGYGTFALIPGGPPDKNWWDHYGLIDPNGKVVQLLAWRAENIMADGPAAGYQSSSIFGESYAARHSGSWMLNNAPLRPDSVFGDMSPVPGKGWGRPVYDTSTNPFRCDFLNGCLEGTHTWNTINWGEGDGDLNNVGELDDKENKVGEVINVPITGKNFRPGAVKTVSNLPVGLAWNPSTQKVEGTIGGTPQDYRVVVQSLINGINYYRTFVWKVTEADLPPAPTWDTIPDQKNRVNDSVYLNYKQYIHNAKPNEVTFEGLPPGLTVGNIDGKITGVTRNKGTYRVKATATTPSGVATTEFTWTVVPRSNPVIVGDDIVKNADEDKSTSVTAYSPDGIAITTFKPVGVLPPGVTWDAATNQLTATKAMPDLLANVSFEAIDADGGSTSHTIQITNKEVNTDPTIETADKEGWYGEEILLNFTVQDPNEGDTLTATIDSVDGSKSNFKGITLNYRSSSYDEDGKAKRDATLKTPDTLAVGIHKVIVIGKDQDGKETIGEFTIKIKDRVLKPIADEHEITNHPIDPVVVTGEWAPTDTLHVDASKLPPGVTFANGKFTGTPLAAGTYPITIEIKDKKGIVRKTGNFTFFVTENGDPEISGQDIVTTLGVPKSTTVTATDPDGDPVDLKPIGALPPGIKWDPATGTLTATDKLPEGTYKVPFQATDNAGGKTDKIINVIVGPRLNEDPTISAAPINTMTGVPAESTIVTSDPDGDTVTVSFATPPQPGITLADGKVKVDGTVPAGDYVVKLKGDDGFGGVAYADVPVHVGQSNRAPVVTATDITVFEHNPGQTRVLVNDPDGDVPTVTITSADSNPLPAEITLDGGYIKVSDKAAPGEYNVRITADDGKGGVGTKDIKVTVINVNDAPTVQVDDIVTDEYKAAESPITITDPDSDVSKTKLTFQVLPNNPEITIEDNKLKVSDKSAPGVYKVKIIATDEEGASSVTEATVTVNNVNDAPEIYANDLTANEREPKDVPFSTFDKDGDPVTVSVVGKLPKGVTVTQGVVTDGKIATDGTTPAGTYTIILKGTDPHGAVGFTQVDITIDNVDAAPTVSVDDLTVKEHDGGSTPINITDPNDPALTDPYIIEFTNPGVVPAGVTIDGKTVKVDPSTKPGVYPLGVKVTDKTGLSSTDTFTITVENVNDAPVVKDGVLETDERKPAQVIIDVTDPDEGDVVTVTIDPSTPVPGVTVVQEGGNWVIKTDGNLPPGDHPVKVVATDKAGLTGTGTITVKINNVDDAPKLDVDDLVIEEHTVGETPITVTDPDGDAGEPKITHGKVPGIEIKDGKLVADGNILKPGDYPIVIEVEDATGLKDAKTVVVTVKDVNDAPVIKDAVINTTEYKAAQTIIDVTDPDAGDVVTVAIDPATAVPGITVVKDGADWVLKADDTVAPGNHVVKLIATDKAGLTATADGKVNVTNVNDAPVVDMPDLVADERVPAEVTGSITDKDGDPIKFVALSDGPVDSVPKGVTLDKTDPTKPVLKTDGTTPPGEYDLIIIAADDKGGFTEQPVKVIINDVNDAPKVDVDDLVADEGKPASTPIVITDPDGPKDIDKVEVLNPPPGVSIKETTDPVTGEPKYELVTDGTTPVGEHPVTVKVTDKAGNVTEIPVKVVIKDVNWAPTATIPVLEADERTPAAVKIDYNDKDGDEPKFTLPYNAPTGLTIEKNPAGEWELKTDGTTPVGTYDFMVTVDDQHGETIKVPAKVIIKNVNDAPTIKPVTLTTDEKKVAYAPIDITDPDGDDFSGHTFNILKGADDVPAGLSVDKSDPKNPKVKTDGTTPVGNYKLKLQVVDGPHTIETDLTVEIGNVNDAPVIEVDPLKANEYEEKSVPVKVTDEDGDPVDLELKPVPGGTIPPGVTLDTTDPDNPVLKTDGTTPPGDYKVVIVGKDPNGGVTEVTVPVTIVNVPDLPVLDKTSINTLEGDPASSAINVTDKDTPIKDLTFKLIDGPDPVPAGVTLDLSDPNKPKVATDGSTPVGVHTFKVEVTDPEAGKTTGDVVVTIGKKNQAPTIGDADFKAREHETAQQPLTVGDPDGDVVTVTLMPGTTVVPQGLWISELTNPDDPTQKAYMINTDGNTPVGKYDLEMWATDGDLTTVGKLTVEIYDVNDAPVIEVDNLVADEHQKGGVAIVVTDLDGDDVALGLKPVDANGIPKGVSIDETDKDNPLLVTDGTTPPGRYTVIITGDDGNGGKSETVATIIINDVNDPPVIKPVELTANEHEKKDVPLDVTDPDGDEMNFKFLPGDTEVPAGIGVSNTGGVYKFYTDGNTKPGVYKFKIRAIDENNAYSDGDAKVTIINVNDAPVIRVAQLNTVEGSAGSVIAFITDPDEGDSIASTDLLKGAEIKVPEGITLTKFGAFWKLSTTDKTPAGLYQLKIKATDTFGLSSEQTVIVKVVAKNDAPVIVVD